LSVFGNTVLTRIYGPKREEVAGGWRLHNKDLHNLYALSNIISVIKLRNLKGRNHSENLGIDKRLIWEWILDSMWSCELDSSGSCEQSNEPSSSIKGGEFLH
jgi:hypothetical protein